MKLSEIIEYAKGEILNPSVFTDDEIVGGCGADLMSDVLTRAKPGAVLLTGLCNLQVVRTAEMADARAIVLLRGKHTYARNDRDLPQAEERYSHFQ